MSLIFAKLAPSSKFETGNVIKSIFEFGTSVPNQRHDYSVDVNGRFSQTAGGIAFIIKCMSSTTMFCRVLKSHQDRSEIYKSLVKR